MQMLCEKKSLDFFDRSGGSRIYICSVVTYLVYDNLLAESLPLLYLPHFRTKINVTLGNWHYVCKLEYSGRRAPLAAARRRNYDAST